MPILKEFLKRHHSGTERESGCDNDKAESFVENDRFQSAKTKKAEQQRQAELCTAKPNKTAEYTNASATAKCCHGIVLFGMRCEHCASLTLPVSAMTNLL